MATLACGRCCAVSLCDENKEPVGSDEGLYFWSMDHIKERNKAEVQVDKVIKGVPVWQASPYLRSTTE